MTIQKLRLFLVVAFFVGIPKTSFSLNILHHDFSKFEQQLASNAPTVEFIHRDKQSADPAGLFGDETLTRTVHKKPWTILVYMAADNDLRAFAANNIKQMASIGSNNNINILIHLDIRLNGNQKITRWYFVDKNKINQMNTDAGTQRMDSGDPRSLVTFCRWGIQNYPAHNYALVLWNHGTGYIDPKYYKIVNPAELFTFNPTTNRFELDRTISYLDLFDYIDLDQRGICWDTSFGSYLTNQKLEAALKEICSSVIHGKFKLIGFDACLMSMVEIGHLVKPYAEVMVGSQEVELGPGWNYMHVLQPFLERSIDNISFAEHIVNAYGRTYHHLTHDLTQSAVDLRKIDILEQNVDLVGRLLLECLQKQSNNTVRSAIQESRHRRVCTHFDEPSYIDLHHFYTNLLVNSSKFRFTSSNNLVAQLNKTLMDGKKIIEKIVFSNTCGKNLKNAKGISIYFPEQHIHSSYITSQFAQENAWGQFIQQVQR